MPTGLFEFRDDECINRPFDAIINGPYHLIAAATRGDTNDVVRRLNQKARLWFDTLKVNFMSEEVRGKWLAALSLAQY